MLKKKKNPFELFLMFGVKLWIQFFFFPRWVILQHHLLKNPSLPLVLIFLCVDFYIVLKFISKDIVLLVLAVLNIFPIRRVTACFWYTKKLLFSVYYYLCPITSLNSLTLCSVLVDSLDFQMFPHVIAT